MQVGELISKIRCSVNSQKCWRLQNHNEYPKIRYGRKWLLGHRVMYQLTNGAIPDGMFVCHKCDNPWCINPKHLFLGSPLDNFWDAVSKNKMNQISDKNRQHVFIDPDNLDLVRMWAKQDGRNLDDQMNWIIRERQALASIESMAS